MSSRLKKLKIVFQYEGVDGLKILDHLLNLFDSCKYMNKFYIHEKSVSTKSIAKKIKEKGYWPTGVSADDFDFGYGTVGNQNQSFFEVKEKIFGLVSDWQPWVDPFLKEKTFVQAWVSDVEYDYWQNILWPSTYQLAGREYLHLPMKSNGLPSPLEEQIIDVSDNPGRWAFHDGYIESIGSCMWLGENFWSYVGQDKKQQLLAESWIHTEVLENGVVKLIAADECFMDESTSDKQNGLREILYGSEQ